MEPRVWAITCGLVGVQRPCCYQIHPDLSSRGFNLEPECPSAELLHRAVCQSVAQLLLGSVLKSLAQTATSTYKEVRIWAAAHGLDGGQSGYHAAAGTIQMGWPVLPPRAMVPSRPRLLMRAMSEFVTPIAARVWIDTCGYRCH